MRAITRLALSVLFTSVIIWAQAINTAAISGTVQDSSGLAVPGAEVKVTQTDTGLVRMVTSGGDGSYLLSNLPIGPYQLQVGKEGFSTYVQSGIVLQVNSNPSVTVQMKVGQVTEQVQVEASAAIVETQSTAVGAVVDNQRVVDLPLNGRQPQELLLLSGPAVQINTQPVPAGRAYPTLGISVAGGSLFGILYELDGAEHSSAEAFVPLPIPFPDALQEFKLETSSTPARYGHHAAATVNMVTKSGGNDIHGDLFEFLRNGDLNARNFFAARRDTLKRNQFGGVIGGAIIKNKLFYFGGYQGTTLRTDPGTAVIVIPTAAMLGGDFTKFAAATSAGGCQTRQINLSAPFVNNQLAPALISPITAKIASWIPSTLVPNQCGQVNYGFPSDSNEKQILVKVDFQKSEKHSLFSRYFTSRYNLGLAVPDGTQNLLGAVSGFDGQKNYANTGLIGDTYLISPTTISSFRVSVQYIPNNNLEPTTAFMSGLGITGVNALSSIPFIGLNVTNSFDIGDAGKTNWKNPYSVIQVTEDIDMTKGNHQIAFGVNWDHVDYNYTSLRLDNGEFAFGGGRTGNGIADFVAGLPSAFNQGYGAQVYKRVQNIGLFVQDGWKATRRLSLNFGVRWEPFLPADSEPGHPFVEQFNMANFLNNVRSQVYVNAPPGLIFPGDSQWDMGLAVAPRHWKQFSPRVGLVFDPRGKGKEVIRAGYGIFYDQPTYEFEIQESNNAPFGNSVTLTNPSLSNPYANYPGGSPFPYALNKTVAFTQPGNYYLMSPELPTPYVQQWNLSIQKQFGSDWSLTVAYIGNKSTHFWIQNEFNPATYFPGSSCAINGATFSPCSSLGNTNQRRLLSLLSPAGGQYYGVMDTTYPQGNGTYEGLVTTVQKRFSRNVSALAVYTWSHCIDIAAQALNNASYDANNPYNVNANRGDCVQDIRNNFSGSFVFTSPKFSNSIVRKIAGNWQLSPIIRIASGLSVNPLSGVDNALDGMTSNTGSVTQRPNLTCDPGLSGNDQTYARWFNTSCFVANGPGQYGTLGRNSLRGPKQTTINVALTRRFAITEKRNIEFRGEAFNLPNLVNPGLPNATLNSALFGKITTAGDPRILQVALKYVF